MRSIIRITIATFLLSLGSVSADELYSSSYSSIDEKSCRTIAITEESGSVTQRCPDYRSIGVITMEGDLRQSITLIRNGKEYPLEYWRTVTSSWSVLGKTAEWRHEKEAPDRLIALITRLNISEDPDNPDRMTSYLVVSKITNNEVCVVGKVAPQRDGSQNLKAREMADRASAMPCKLVY